MAPQSRRLISLREWAPPTTLDLDAEELAELQSAGADLVIRPASPGHYSVQATSTVGSVRTPRLHLLIRPKLGIERVFHLLAMARRIRFLRSAAELGEHDQLTDGFIAVYLNMVQQRLRRGLLKGYRVAEESLHGIRGRVRMADQMRRRFGLPVPVEVTYDDYTEDIPENRLLKAALRRLALLRPESEALRARIAEGLAAMALVSDVRYGRNNLLAFHYTRLTEPYRPVLELSALILENSAVELKEGERELSAFLFDMNKVFEDFVFESLRRRLTPRFGSLDRFVQGQALSLDRQGVLRPEPDLAWLRGRRYVFVGDAKYKRTVEGELSDLYQLLAYCSAADLHTGLLIYAEQAPEARIHEVVHDGPELRVTALNLETETDVIETRCDELARVVAKLATPGRSR
jgi:5-methylcytosine-specific restriction enzyme subunit McrC